MKTKPKISTINDFVSQFLYLKNTFELSELLNVQFDSFVFIIENASYREFNIPKAKGGKRTIEAPSEHLLIIQKRLNKYLQAVYYKIKPNEAYGFIQSIKDEPHTHSIVTNAQHHTNKKYVLNIDLKDFFHSISATKVRALFQSYPFNFSEDLATCIALICCWNSRLPMGAPTSPVVSNLICLGLDKELIAITKKYNLVYTRYADDLTFSFDSIITDKAIAEIKNAIAENKFTINQRKFRLQSKYRQQTVTGIKVNTKPNVDRRYIRNIRAILHDIKLNGLASATIKHFKMYEVDEKLMHSFLEKLNGKINFVGQVRGKDDLIYNILRQKLKLHWPETADKNGITA